MSALTVTNQFPIFNDTHGSPLDDGYVYVGVTGMNPETNPIQVYWDAGLTIPAAQPIRTIGGYASRSGGPAQIYADAVNYSILVKNKNGALVLSSTSGTGISPTADGVVYLPAGVGAVPTTVQTKLRESVSVKDFGAVGDGVTNDAAAVQLAIDRVAAVGRGVVIFPPGGTYYLNSQINLCDNLILWGYGAKLKLGTGFAGSNKPLFKNFSGTEFVAPGTRLASKNIAFLGFEIDGQDTGIPATLIPNASMHGAIICCGGWTADSGVDGLTVRDCNMYSFAGAGVMAWKSSNINVSENQFTNFFANVTLSMGSAVDFHEVTRATVTNNRINHTSSGYSWHGMVVLDWDTGSSDIVISGNVITNMNQGDGISCEGNSNDNLDKAVISSNVIANCVGDGIGVDKCIEVTVSNNTIRTVGGMGINISMTETLLIDGNNLSGCKSAIWSNGSTLRAIVTNNRIQECTYLGANYQGEAIFINGSTSDSASAEIIGNSIKDVDGCGIFSNLSKSIVANNCVYNWGRSVSATRDWGIWSQGLVTNNILVSGGTHATYGINIEDGGSVKGNQISGAMSGGQYRVGWRNSIYGGGYIDYDNLCYDDITKKILTYGAAAPASSRWVVGDVVYNTTPAAAGSIGWVCTTAGVPGTWKTFGAIAA